MLPLELEYHNHYINLSLIFTKKVKCSHREFQAINPSDLTAFEPESSPREGDMINRNF